MGKATKRKPTSSQRDSAGVAKEDNSGLSNGFIAGESDIDVLQARLARLEQLQLSQASGSGNMLKFAFFFIMGVALTVFLYPRISLSLQAMNEDTNYQTETDQSMVLNDASDENEVQIEKVRTKQYAGAVTNAKSNKSVKEIIVDPDNLEDADLTTAHTKFEPTSASNTENSNNQNVTGKTERLRTNEETVIKLGTGETKEINIEMVSSKQNDVGSNDKRNTDTKTVKVPDTFEGETVTLTNVKVDERGTEVGSKTAADKNSKPSQANHSTKTNDMSKSNKNTRKSKSQKSKQDKTDKTDNLPPEIKNFKATYQREVTPKKTFIDGRRVPPMELLPQNPNNSSVRVWLFEEFLSEAECDGLRRVHNKHVQEQSVNDPILCFDSIKTLRQHLKNVGKRVPVSPGDFTAGTTCVNASFSSQLKEWFHGNWSYSTAFYPGESPFARVFENRVKQAMGLAPENGGKFQITSYPMEIGYKAHTDCTEDSDKRDRMATVLVYLDTVEEGGETEFTELGIWARPRKGRALMWNNMNPEGDCEPLSIHRANKVLKGHKFILQRWYYYQSFYSLGKRPPEPPLPERKPGQPRVSCDEYEHGSCRWYDEWNFEHMIEYERQKYSLV